MGGIVGDPSRKRGLELGYDVGLKAARQENATGTAPDAKAHPEYQNPDKWYRYEYGSRAQFMAGFRSGFLGAYRKFAKKSMPGAPKVEKRLEDITTQFDKRPAELASAPVNAELPTAAMGIGVPESSRPAPQSEGDAL